MVKISREAAQLKKQVISLSKTNLSRCYLDSDFKSHRIGSRYKGKNDLLNDKATHFLRALDDKVMRHIEELKHDKKFCESVLKLERKLKVSWIKGSNKGNQHFVTLDKRNAMHNKLRSLRTIVLKSYFHTKLHKQREQLEILKEYFSRNENEFLEKKFIETTLKNWETNLDKGKLIVIPKWYHCTKSRLAADSIANSEIKVRARAFYGAFVSLKPERSYGNYCFVMGDSIEEPRSWFQRLFTPRFTYKSTNFQNCQGKDVVKSAKDLKNPANLTSKKTETLWVGFQHSIRIKRHNKEKDLIRYYDEKNAEFIATEDSYNAGTKHIKAISFKNLDDLRRLCDAAFPLTLPNNWDLSRGTCITFWF